MHPYPVPGKVGLDLTRVVLAICAFCFTSMPANAFWASGHDLKSKKPFEMSCRAVKNARNMYGDPNNLSAEDSWLKNFRLKAVVDPSMQDVSLEITDQNLVSNNLPSRINFVSPTQIGIFNITKIQSNDYRFKVLIIRSNGKAVFAVDEETVGYKVHSFSWNGPQWKEMIKVEMECKYTPY